MESKEIKALKLLQVQGFDAGAAEIGDKIKKAFVDHAEFDERQRANVERIFEAFYGAEVQAEWKEIVAPAFASRLTGPELDQLIATMGSPLFQKYLRVQREVAAEIYPKLQEHTSGKVLDFLTKILKGEDI